MTGYLLRVKREAGGWRVVNLGDDGRGNVVARMERADGMNKTVRARAALGLYPRKRDAAAAMAWLMGEAPLPAASPLPEGDDTASPFAVRLRELRVTAGLTVAELASKAGLDRPNLYKLEAGERRPTWDTVCQLAAALGVPTDAFRDA